MGQVGTADKTPKSVSPQCGGFARSNLQRGAEDLTALMLSTVNNLELN